MIKRVICIVLILASVLSLASCGTTSVGMESLTLDEVQSKRAAMSITEKEGLIYQYVADRITVGSDKLMKIDADDLNNINSLCEKINNDLIKGTTNCLSVDHMNYMLTEFLKTPYEWQQTNVMPVGFDPASRLYFVDVTYSTTSTLKSVIPASSLPKGSPAEDVLSEARVEEWNKYLDSNYRDPSSAKTANLYNTFVSHWGNPDEIMKDQQGVTLLDRTAEYGVGGGGIGRLTYEGLLTNGYLANIPATMTFRFVLKYNYNLGEETDLGVSSLYLKGFELQPTGGLDNFLNSFKLADATGIEVLKPFIDRTLLSYNKAVEETNYVGLYSLFSNFAKHDKYYEMLGKYAYIGTDAYSYRVIERTGTSLLVRVDRVNKIRAKGEPMSMPTYDEILIFDMVLDTDDTIKIQGVYPMRSTLSGEPISVIKNVNGVSDLIQYEGVTFTDTNKKAVEEAIAEFGQSVINQDVESDSFLSTVDLGVSQDVLQELMQNIRAINADKKVTYVISWDTQTNVYCTVNVREIFITSSGNYDTEAIINVANTGKEWKVVGYERTLNIKTDNSTFDENTALCTNTKGGEISYGADYGKSVVGVDDTDTSEE